MSLMSYDQAQEIIKKIPPYEDDEEVSLSDGLGRCLSQDATAEVCSPPFTNSAMDGYALVREEAQKGALEVTDTIYARPLDKPPEKKPMGCIKVMTGAYVPNWADTIIPVEDAIEKDGKVSFRDLGEAGRHFRKEAEDFKKGDVFLPKGSVLSPETLSTAAFLGLTHFKVKKRPRLVILSTGDELLMPGEKLPLGGIYNSSRFFLEAAFKKLGFEASVIKTIPDCEKLAAKEVEELLESHKEPTLFVTTGAVSAGDKDFIPLLARSLGFEALFHKVAIRPGKPVYLATKGERFIWLGLPGNAVSTMVGFHFFARPLLNHWAGTAKPERITVTLENDVKKPHHLRCFWRASLDSIQGTARCLHSQGSSMLLASTQANAYIELPEGTDKVEAGTRIQAQYYL